ncbi:tRNA pseudouridine(38-40) synthase TruA [Mucilaginibacter myungsuensis]|uniref:tRNA pseudouridine synthase A n=1 Tax=Mucilaginibacter myungsuensis TaxID=649104 RepID=A0A929KWG4_9SPHI|nr:tRNA pseudouridine(38-40) synthase TruA [Mucilaginibacter myungsuensis]MBE9661952.1 tRNA pseudouridine(38-40) synthase TruA [Mucilaginibacter myungsuensis]MDN3599615.1 tRNA pseudouridine(38-40) synthase TruA [Mucilaginibacter myungsuensis]
MRYFFHIAYHGSNYSGWQKHPDGPSVQDVLEIALSRILKRTTIVYGCGRTDAGVHASQFFFHIDADEVWDFDLIFRLNNVLPDDISIFDIIPAQNDAHARFDAIQRGYDYYINCYKDPFLNRFSSYYPAANWDLGKMQQAANLLLKYNDYYGFCKTPDRNKHTLCEVSAAQLFADDTGDRLRFHISANRFLGKMVRTIIGKLMDVGSNKISVKEFESILAYPQLAGEIKPAYPQGLYLSKVTYPYLDLPARSSFGTILSGEAASWTKV